MADIVVATDMVARCDREAYWHHVLADTFAPVQLDGWAEPANPSAHLEGTVRGRLLFAELDATPHVHRRTPRQIRQAEGIYFQIAVLTRGAGSLQQDGRLAELRPGDFVVYENSRPFTWTFTQPWSVAVLSIPGNAVRLADGERRAVSARPLSGRDGLSGVVGRFVLDLVRHASHLDEAQSERVLAHAADLVISLLATPGNTEYADAADRTMKTRIKAYITEHLCDPALNPAEIAAAVNISTRYLHKLFEADHHTVSLYIKGLRLERARRDLLDPRLAGRPISAIAYSCGFGDLSGFNRAFKQAYALSPNELRNASASAAESATCKPGGPGHG